MTRPRPRIGSELLPLFMILLCLGGTFALVLAMHRRAAVARRMADAPKVAPLPPAAPTPEPVADPEPPVVVPPLALVEDPTKKALAQLSTAESAERAETEKADRRAESLEAARKEALARSERWRRRESLVRAQIDDLNERARQLQTELDSVAMERDVLARERDVAKAALAKARTTSSYAILPHKGPNGTWRRPIVVECRNGAAILQPGGAAFGMLELSALGGLRSSPFVRAVARELVRISGQSGPDGAANVPYIFFLIRPDGIRPYYEARGRLEALGIAFGYELVDQDWEIDFSELENPTDSDLLAPGRAAASPPAVADREELSWPGERPGAKRSGNSKDPGDAFVWHSRPTGTPGSTRNGQEDGGEGSEPVAPFSGGSSNRAVPGGGGLRAFGAQGADSPGLGGPRLGGARPGASGLVESDGGRGGNTRPGMEEEGAGATPGTNSHDPSAPFGVSGGPSATERAFGTPGRLAPVGRGGMPPLEPAEGASGENGRGPGGRALAQNDALVPFGGLPRGRAGGAGNVGQNAAGGAASDDDEPPNDGRVPVLPRGYFDDKEDDEETSGAQTGASRGSGKSNGAQGSADSSGNPSEGSSGSSGQPPLGLSGGSPGAVSGSAGSPHGTKGAGSASRKGNTLTEKPHLRIEVPFEMTVVCSRNGVIIHPGGYRLSPSSLKSKDQMLVKELNAVLQQRREVDPLIVPQPRLKFLVESGGGQSYEDARKQTALAGLAWPTTIQVGETKVMSFSGQETRR